MTGAATDHIRIPLRDQLLVGGLVLAISVAAFFRVPLLPSIGLDLGMSISDLGLITTVFALGRLATDVPAGRLGDRVSVLRMLVAGGAFLAVGSVGVATSRVGTQVIASAFVLGIGSAIANTTGMLFFSTAQAPERRGRSLAVFTSALLVGQSLGPALGGGLATLAGWRPTIATAAAVGVAVVVIGLGIDAHRARHGLHVTTGRPIPRPRGTRPTGPFHAPRLQIALLNAVAFSTFFVLGAMPQTLLPIIGANDLALSPGLIGAALGLGGLCRLIGALIGGRTSDLVSRKVSLVPGLALNAVGIGVLLLDLGLTGWLIAIVLMSLGSYGVSVGATMLADHSLGTGIGRRLGTYRFVGDLGLILGPALATSLFERVGNAAAVITVAAVPAVVAIACAFLLKETRWLHERATVVGEDPR